MGCTSRILKWCLDVSCMTHLNYILNLSFLLKNSTWIWNTKLAWRCTQSESALLIKHRRLATWNPAPIVDSGISQQRNVRLRPTAAIKISHGKNATVANCLTQVPLRPTAVSRISNWFSEWMWTKHLFHGKAMQSLVLSPSKHVKHVGWKLILSLMETCATVCATVPSSEWAPVLSVSGLHRPNYGAHITSNQHQCRSLGEKLDWVRSGIMIFVQSIEILWTTLNNCIHLDLLATSMYLN